MFPDWSSIFHDQFRDGWSNSAGSLKSMKMLDGPCDSDVLERSLAVIREGELIEYAHSMAHALNMFIFCIFHHVTYIFLKITTLGLSNS